MEKSTTGNFSPSIDVSIMNEFKKSFLENFDLHFILILAIALIIESVLAVFMSRKPVEEYSETEIQRIQERFANFVLKQPEAIQTTQSDVDLAGAGNSASQTESEGDEGQGNGEGDQSGEGEGRGEVTAETRQTARMAAAQARAESRANLSRQVSNKGLLGMLTGTGSSVDGNAVSSLFSGSGSNELAGNLDEVLSSAGGLKTQGQSGFGGSGNGDGFGNVKGSRSGQKASIDDLVSTSETTGSSSLSRKGGLVVETSADLAGRGSKSAYRNYEAVQEVVNGHNSAIVYCYERELKRNPTLKGKVTVRFVVSPDGHVINVSILNSTLNNDRVERCILSRIRLWKDFKPIDPSEGNSPYRQTYVFGY